MIVFACVLAQIPAKHASGGQRLLDFLPSFPTPFIHPFLPAILAAMAPTWCTFPLRRSLAFAASALILTWTGSDLLGKGKASSMGKTVGNLTLDRSAQPIFRLGSGAYGTIHGNVTKPFPRRLKETTKILPGNLRAGVERDTSKHRLEKEIVRISPMICIGIV